MEKNLHNCGGSYQQLEMCSISLQSFYYKLYEDLRVKCQKNDVANRFHLKTTTTKNLRNIVKTLEGNIQVQILLVSFFGWFFFPFFSHSHVYLFYLGVNVMLKLLLLESFATMGWKCAKTFKSIQQIKIYELYVPGWMQIFCTFLRHYMKLVFNELPVRGKRISCSTINFLQLNCI